MLLFLHIAGMADIIVNCAVPESITLYKGRQARNSGRQQLIVTLAYKHELEKLQEIVSGATGEQAMLHLAHDLESIL